MLRRDIRTIRRTTLEHIPCLLEAQLAYLNHDPTTSRAQLERAELLFVESGMALFAAVCAFGLGTVGTGDPAQRATAERWMKEQGIKNPRKFVRLLAPAFAG